MVAHTSCDVGVPIGMNGLWSTDTPSSDICCVDKSLLWLLPAMASLLVSNFLLFPFRRSGVGLYSSGMTPAPSHVTALLLLCCHVGSETILC